ncbi:MAG: hypothetical protein L3J12_00015 [Spirochaetales bacterium]|nr:hypothetical protein [Spirochaetales bacterium]
MKKILKPFLLACFLFSGFSAGSFAGEIKPPFGIRHYDIGKAADGSIVTPKASYLASWSLRFKHWNLLRKLKKGDISIDNISAIKKPENRQEIFNVMGELTSGSGNEIALINTGKEYILRRAC